MKSVLILCTCGKKIVGNLSQVIKIYRILGQLIQLQDQICASGGSVVVSRDPARHVLDMNSLIGISYSVIRPVIKCFTLIGCYDVRCGRLGFIKIFALFRYLVQPQVKEADACGSTVQCLFGKHRIIRKIF